ncbi:YhcH/YjgK/YiaL family protein [Maridesulfovibrio frigidus]|uniref:YhcH/YjgK/YiaL family protein n=1 Tax=Maridesulfovibrio frigidus TaxID=340956 RepID=UPI0004E24355|nr:YhcH/YjgK/YiaL family protein [Maridesulfovibrio frigidus]
MIIDSLEHASKYKFGPAWEKTFEFLAKVDPAIEEGKHIIDGDNVFALVSEYKTKDYDKGRFEAHRKYVDIQFLISGREKLGYASLQALEEETPYDSERDVEFLKDLPEVPSISTLIPGIFMAFFPQDGHMPGLAYDKPEPVKKIVIKIAINAL